MELRPENNDGVPDKPSRTYSVPRIPGAIVYREDGDWYIRWPSGKLTKLRWTPLNPGYR